MTEEINLAEISSTTAADAPVAEPVAETVEATAEPEVAVNETDNVIDSCTKLYDILINNDDKLVGCHRVDISAIAESQPYNYLMYATDLEKDKSLILVSKADQIAVLTDYIADIQSIRVMDSGVVINTVNARIYVNMSGTTHFSLNENGTTAGKVIVSKIKKNACVLKNGELPVHAEVDAVRQIVKVTSIRMLKVIEAETTPEGFRAKTLEFMGGVRDINHLLKLENEILSRLD